jgi:glycosyltransferase involved in cell wall biosynthesis
MHRVLLPYVLGSGSPIPYLFEGILPHFSDHYNFRALAKGDVSLPNNVSAIRISDQGTLATAVQYGRLAIGPYDLIHTGAFERQIHVSRLTSLRNRNITRVHSIRVDVDPEGKYGTEVYRELSERADVTTAVSEHTAETVREHFGIDPIVIYNAVDMEWFRPGYDRPELFAGLGIEGPVFLFVGSLEERKRPSHVIDVAESVPEATFLLVGDGSLAETLNERASGLDNVVIPGRIKKDRLPAVYANARGLIFPSVREGCPNVVMEAMAAGIPTVGYRATSMPELIEHGERGLLADTDDVAGLTDHVERLLDADEAEDMGASARSYVRENHTFDQIAAQYESLYADLLG